MKLKLLSVVLLLTLAFTCLSGCSDDTVRADNENLDIKAAAIEDVSISISESYPEQVIAYIKGGLEDSCTCLHEIVIEPNGYRINISVTTERPIDAICAQVYSSFEENVNLGSSFIRGQTYTVDVNGVIRTFQYPS